MKVLSKPVADKSKYMDLLRQMKLIRRFEEKASEMYMRGKIGGFLHLYIGEEAIATGVMSVLGPDDYVVSHYREHGHALARGMDPRKIMAELFGRATGTSKGKGGSMHLFDASRGFLGGYAIVGAMMPIAVGLGLASKQQGNDRVTVCFFGDGAVSEGEFHESLNLAALWKLPVVFFCENNGYGMGSPVTATFAGKDISRLAEAYGMPCCSKIDGMDVFDVIQATQTAVERARKGQGPTFIEAMTYRFRGHSMADPMEYRKKTEEQEWRQKEPILCMRRQMEELDILTSEELQAMEQEIDEIIEDAVRFADESPVLPTEAIYDDVYADEA
ncbi:MAG: pyruvate dehydrogenase (acetyl-transferring) E1 component subunit alpha [Chloroflexi bacterium]|nr:pyruvate dehydrogenase (acetyl-transferring) E1 component subunit alpha [Chloroflexota bacterium]